MLPPTARQDIPSVINERLQGSRTDLNRRAATPRARPSGGLCKGHAGKSPGRTVPRGPLRLLGEHACICSAGLTSILDLFPCTSVPRLFSDLPDDHSSHEDRVRRVRDRACVLQEVRRDQRRAPVIPGTCFGPHALMGLWRSTTPRGPPTRPPRISSRRSTALPSRQRTVWNARKALKNAQGAVSTTSPRPPVRAV